MQGEGATPLTPFDACTKGLSCGVAQCCCGTREGCNKLFLACGHSGELWKAKSMQAPTACLAVWYCVFWYKKAFCTLYGGLLRILATVGTSYRCCSKYLNPNRVMLLAADPQLGYISGGELQFHKNGACDWHEVVSFSLRSHVFLPTHVHHPNRGWPRNM